VLSPKHLVQSALQDMLASLDGQGAEVNASEMVQRLAAGCGVTIMLQAEANRHMRYLQVGLARSAASHHRPPAPDQPCEEIPPASYQS
jgi:hypothetical protein